MAEGIRIAFSFAACAAGYVLLQRLAARGARLPLRADALAAVFGLYAAGLFLLLTARPFMTALLALALLGLLLVLNRAKEKALHEPLVPADAYLLRQVFKYPHLYFPFLPMKGIAAGLALVVLALAVLLYLDTPLPAIRTPGATAALLCGTFALPAVLILMWKGRLPSVADTILSAFPPATDVAGDAGRNGPMAVLANHPAWTGAWERQGPDFLRNPDIRPEASRFPESMERMLAELETTPPDKRPHIVLIQAESFCDIRKYVDEPLKSALKDFLPNWDKLKAEGRAFDPPENAYGAYTMRTEFAMLTGLHAEDLGPWAFNPYLLAARRSLWSLAKEFRMKGYNTLCTHPYHKDFFRRDHVMLNLGFQRFLGIDELDHLEKFGPYTSDKALGNKILHETTAAESSGRPLFCFAITMEAHGPWLGDRLTEKEMTTALADIDPWPCTPTLRMYLCHLRHMDEMLGLLAKKTTGRDIRVYTYGDHAPGLSLNLPVPPHCGDSGI